MKKNNESFKYFKSMFSYHIKSWIFLGVAVFLSVFLMCFVTASFENLTQSIQEDNATRFGIHHAIIYNISDQQKEGISDEDRVKSIGSIRNHGVYSIKNTDSTITIGSFDKNASLMAHLKLVGGEFPKTDYDIVLEQNVVNKIQGLKIGKKITIINDNQIGADFTIVGIVKDYSAQWNLPERIVRGKIGLPDAIVTGKAEFLSTDLLSENIMLQYNNYNDEFIFSHLKKQGVDDYNGLPNTRYYGSGQEEIRQLNLFSNVFYIGLLFVMGIFIYFTNMFIFDKESNSFRILRILGASYWKMGLAYLLQVLLIFLPFLTMGVVAGLFVTNLIYDIGDGQTSFFQNTNIFARCIIFIVVYIIIAVIVYCRNFFLVHKRNLSIKTGSSKIMMEVHENFLKTYPNHNFKYNLPKQIIPILSLCLIVVLIGLMNVHFQGLSGGFEDQKPAFYIKPYTTEVYKTFGSYKLYQSTDRTFSIDDLDEVVNLSHIRFWQADVKTDGAVIYSSANKNMEYWNLFNEIGENNSDFLSNKHPVSNMYKIIISNNDLTSVISKRYSTNVNNSDVILFTPNYTGSQISDLDFSVLEISNNADFFSAVKNTSEIKQSTASLLIDKHINEMLDIEINGVYVREDVPVIIIPVEKLKNYDFLNGIQGISLYTDLGLGEQEMLDINDTVKSFAYRYPDAYFYSQYEELMRAESSIELVNTTGIFLTIALSVFAFIMFYSILYFSWISRKKSIAILRVLGLKHIELKHIIFSELLMNTLLFIGLSVLSIFLLLWFTQSYNILPMMIVIIASISVLLMLLGKATIEKFAKRFVNARLATILKNNDESMPKL